MNESIRSIATLGIDLFAEATDQGLARKAIEEGVEAGYAAGMTWSDIDLIALQSFKGAQNGKGKDQIDKELADNGYTGITGVARHHFTRLKAAGIEYEVAREMAVELTVEQFDTRADVLRNRTWERREDGSCQHQSSSADIQWIDEEAT